MLGRIKAIDSSYSSVEEYKKMVNVWRACYDADVEVPKMVLDYLGIKKGEKPSELGVEFTGVGIEFLRKLSMDLKRQGIPGITEISTTGLVKGINKIIIVPERY